MDDKKKVKPIEEEKLEEVAGGYNRPSDGEYWAIKEGKPERKYDSDN